MPVEVVNLQRKFPIDPLVFGKIAELGLESLKRSKDEIVLIFLNDQRMRHLNQTFRGKRKTTDVLSFSYKKEKTFKGLGTPDGEVVISLQQAKRQSVDAEIPFFDEIVNLIIHGLCHLKGYDHELGTREALLMKNAERKTAIFIEKGYSQWVKKQSVATFNDTDLSFKGKIPDDLLPPTKRAFNSMKRKETRN